LRWLRTRTNEHCSAQSMAAQGQSRRIDQEPVASAQPQLPDSLVGPSGSGQEPEAAKPLMQGQLPAHSLSQVLVEEAANLCENLLRFGRAIVAQIMRVRLSLVDLKYGLHAGLTQLAMHPHRIAE
jgi:hypothetical protein